MVPRAERHRRLNQQRDRAFGDLIGIVTAIDKEPARNDGGQFAFDLGHPIHVGQFGNSEILGLMHRCQQGQTGHIGGLVEIAADLP